MAKKIKHITINLDVDQFAAVEQIAIKEERTTADTARRLLLKELNKVSAELNNQKSGDFQPLKWEY